MNLDTLVLDPADAVERVKEYEAQIAEERTVEDDAVLAGYRAAARGLPVISLRAAFEAAGRFPNSDGHEGAGLPRLAVVRADATECRVGRSQFGGWLFDDCTTRWSPPDRGALVGRHTVRVPVEGTDWRARGRTVVPTIPPRHRPNKRRLHRFHILWEVEAWTPEPPVDPALLRHIRGDLWAVQAVWDLTPLERAVLAQRGS
jgi:hypothetical protein